MRPDQELEPTADRSENLHGATATAKFALGSTGYPMPWSFKATIAMFVVFAAGAGLIGFACFETGWQAIRHFAWGLLTAGVGLIGGLLFSIICAVTQPAWRRRSLFAGVLGLLLLAGLVLFAKTA